MPNRNSSYLRDVFKRQIITGPIKPVIFKGLRGGGGWEFGGIISFSGRTGKLSFANKVLGGRGTREN